MRPIAVLVTATLLATAPTTAEAATARPKPRLLSCDAQHRLFKPRTYVLACGDGNAYVQDLRWTSWTGKQATATGSFVVNDCRPACFEGHFHSYPAALVFDKVRSTAHYGQQFHRLTVTFTRKSPTGKKTLVDTVLYPQAG